MANLFFLGRTYDGGLQETMDKTAQSTSVYSVFLSNFLPLRPFPADDPAAGWLVTAYQSADYVQSSALFAQRIVRKRQGDKDLSATDCIVKRV